MQLKRYEAKSVNEAMVKIKKDLGPDAVVLSSKRVKGDRGAYIEVMAARDEDLAFIGSRKPFVTPRRIRVYTPHSRTISIT